MLQIPMHYIPDFCICCIVPRVASVDFDIGEVSGLFVDDAVNLIATNSNLVQETTVTLLFLGDFNFCIFVKWDAFFSVDAIIFVVVNS